MPPPASGLGERGPPVQPPLGITHHTTPGGMLLPAEAPDERVAAFVAKMKAAGCSQTAIDAFSYNFSRLTSGESLFIAERDIEPVAELPLYESLSAEEPALLTQTVMLKLNGGLGTGMGLEKAKSLLPLKDGLTFLDFIARQVGHMRAQYETPLAFLLMNSFATSKDTLAHLARYAELGTGGLPLEFVQNKAPKVAAADLSAGQNFLLIPDNRFNHFNS